MSALASNSVQKQGNSAWSSGCSCGFSSEGFGLAPGRNILTIPVICGCLRCLLWDRSQAAVSAGGWSVLSARAELSTSFLPEGIQFAGGKTTWQTQPKCSKGWGGTTGVDFKAAPLHQTLRCRPSCCHPEDGNFCIHQLTTAISACPKYHRHPALCIGKAGTTCQLPVPSHSLLVLGGLPYTRELSMSDSSAS